MATSVTYTEHISESPKADEILFLAHMAAAEIETEYSTSTYKPDTYKATPFDTAVYAEEDGKIVSMAVALSHYDGLWIGMAWTHQDYRAMGYYKCVYQFLKNKAKELGKKSISCGVEHENHTSHGVHLSLGMTPGCIVYTDQL